MRKAWSAKWDVPGSDEQKAHQGAQENVQRNIDNLIDQIKRKCREKCGGFDVPMRFEPPEPEFT